MSLAGSTEAKPKMQSPMPVDICGMDGADMRTRPNTHRLKRPTSGSSTSSRCSSTCSERSMRSTSARELSGAHRNMLAVEKVKALASFCKGVEKEIHNKIFDDEEDTEAVLEWKRCSSAGEPVRRVSFSDCSVVNQLERCSSSPKLTTSPSNVSNTTSAVSELDSESNGGKSVAKEQNLEGKKFFSSCFSPGSVLTSSAEAGNDSDDLIEVHQRILANNQQALSHNQSKCGSSAESAPPVQAELDAAKARVSELEKVVRRQQEEARRLNSLAMRTEKEKQDVLENAEAGVMKLERLLLCVESAMHLETEQTSRASTPESPRPMVLERQQKELMYFRKREKEREQELAQLRLREREREEREGDKDKVLANLMLEKNALMLEKNALYDKMQEMHQRASEHEQRECERDEWLKILSSELEVYKKHALAMEDHDRAMLHVAGGAGRGEGGGDGDGGDELIAARAALAQKTLASLVYDLSPEKRAQTARQRQGSMDEEEVKSMKICFSHGDVLMNKCARQEAESEAARILSGARRLSRSMISEAREEANRVRHEVRHEVSCRTEEKNKAEKNKAENIFASSVQRSQFNESSARNTPRGTPSKSAPHARNIRRSAAADIHDSASGKRLESEKSPSAGVVGAVEAPRDSPLAAYHRRRMQNILSVHQQTQ